MRHAYTQQTIRQAVKELDTAIFRNQGDGIMHLPNTLVTNIRMDENGACWFTISSRLQDFGGLDPIFPASLHFYKKDKPYYMDLTGTATLVSAATGSLTIQLSIEQAEITGSREPAPPAHQFSLDGIRQWINNGIVSLLPKHLQ